MRGAFKELGGHEHSPNNEGNLGSDGLLDTGSSKRRADQGWLVAFCDRLGQYSDIIRDEDSRSSSTGLLHGIRDVGENGAVEVSSTGLLGVGTTDNIGACVIYEFE